MVQRLLNEKRKRHNGGLRSKMELKPHPSILNNVGEGSLQLMNPGDIILLDESASLRPMVEQAYFAVLSCPCCGTPGLVTIPQYCGVEPVTCGSDSCSCRFRIIEKSRLEYLPVN
jgi:hypothetical protein